MQYLLSNQTDFLHKRFHENPLPESSPNESRPPKVRYFCD